MGKKLLIIGNGFDLAHGLPTLYTDFLNFAKNALGIFESIEKDLTVDEFVENCLLHWKNGNDKLKQLLKEEYTILSSKDTDQNSILVLFRQNLIDNIWYEYFKNIYAEKKIRGKNWIDFESEISEIIQWLNNNYHISAIDDVNYEKMIRSDESNSKTMFFYQCCDKTHKKYDNIEVFINALYDDMERLTIAFEIYLVEFVEKIDTTKIDIIEKIKPDYVISFNYTHTYSKTYNADTPVCYIHGECRTFNKRHETNMVLGINEYFDAYQANQDTDYAIFRKYIQRIRKKNDTRYQSWRVEMEKKYEDQKRRNVNSRTDDYFQPIYSDIYVYGHSLDVTDIDILNIFLGRDYSIVHLFAKGKTNEGKLICNLIKIMGQEKLIEKSIANPPRVDFQLV